MVLYQYYREHWIIIITSPIRGGGLKLYVLDNLIMKRKRRVEPWRLSLRCNNRVSIVQTRWWLSPLFSSFLLSGYHVRFRPAQNTSSWKIIITLPFNKSTLITTRTTNTMGICSQCCIYWHLMSILRHKTTDNNRGLAFVKFRGSICIVAIMISKFRGLDLYTTLTVRRLASPSY